MRTPVFLTRKIVSLRRRLAHQKAGGGAWYSEIRLGITTRLVITFSSVAILAAAANLIAERGAAVIRTATERSPVSTPTAAVRPAPKLDIPVVPALQAETLSSAAFQAALEEFKQATDERTDSPSSDSDSRFQRSRHDLQQETSRFVADAAARGAPLPKLTGKVKTYIQHGNALVSGVDARRAAFVEYLTRLDAMQTRVRSSLDQAWKILGRVVARQSLLKLSAGLSEIRRLTAVLDPAESYREADIARLRDSEAEVEAILEKNAKGFARTDGAAWMIQMRDDMAQLAKLRDAILIQDRHRGSDERKFEQLGKALVHSIPAAVSAPAPPSAAVTPPVQLSATTAPTNSAPAEGATTAPTNFAPAEDVTTAASIETTITQVPGSDRHRALVAWISFGVLIALMLISALTVRSIVVPVRRLLRATVQISKGLPAQIPRGGIKELDMLSVSFNDMARRIAAANEATRNHQQNLESKIAERTAQLKDLAERDSLTQMPNRRHFFMLLNAAIETAGRDGRRVGVFFVDIDNFKNINDGMGHEFGDRVLAAIAQRLGQAAQAFGFAARLGGDEFTVVYSSAATVEEVRAAGLSLVQAFTAPLTVDGRDLHLSISIGASVYPDHESTAEALLRAADTALFRAKSLGRHQLSMFTSELLQLAADRFATEQGLRRALARGEFELVFQPELCLETLEATLVEALIRWRLPDGRLASPGEFLPVAEESGLIADIGDWVLREAIQTAAAWHRGEWPNARIAINVSPRQLMDSRFVDKVQGLLKEFELPPRCIELELTETVLQTGAGTIDTLRNLQTLGIAIALDDFGTGYSSLSSLEQLPLTRIKLDRSLIDRIDTKPRSAAIARAIIDLCQGLELEITAEGIERPEQFHLLSNCRSMYLQGYLLSRPVSREDLLPVLRKLPLIAQDLVLSAPGAADSASLTSAMTAEARNGLRWKLV